MSNISDIRKDLVHGDRKIIAGLVNCSDEMVRKVLNGERSHNKGKGKKIIEVAEKIIELRSEMKRLIG